ncbi:MAG: GNAT family N-acetyltransferase [bacterium]
MAYEIRTLREEEIPQLVDLLDLVFHPDGGWSMGDAFPTLVCPENLEQIRILVDGGRIASHVGMTIRDVCLGGIPTTVVNIGGVATHPDHRGQGHATVLMADAVQHARSRGADIMLISGGRGLYRRMNAADCGSFPTLQLSAEDVEAETLSARRVQEEDLPIISDIRQREPVRYQLPMEDLKKLLRCGFAMAVPVEWWLFSEGERPVAFGVVAKEIRDGEARARLIEWNGDAEALRSAWATWHRELEVEKFDVVTVSNMNLPLAWRPRVRSHVSFEGTVLVLHAHRLLDRAKSWIAERLDTATLNSLEIAAGETSVRFSLGDDTVQLNNGGELAELFFGVAGRDVIGEKTSAGSPLESALRQLFPIPLVWYGLAFI